MNDINYEEYLTDKDKKSLEIMQALNKDFRDKLIDEVFDFRDITAQDIINIVYEGKAGYFQIDPTHICKQIGVELEEINDKEEANINGHISLTNDKKLVIKYRLHKEHHKNKIIIAHELGHLFCHLINGINANKDLIQINNEKTVLLAAKRTEKSKLEEQAEKEKQADLFAGELLLTDEAINSLEEKFKNDKISASNIVNFFEISPSILRERIHAKKNIDIRNDDNFIIADVSFS